jgi:regulator of sigma E protease
VIEIFSHPIPAVIVLLGLLVFVHEFGHFAIGRGLGIAVEIFSIGFGPQILSWTRKGVGACPIAVVLRSSRSKNI